MCTLLDNNKKSCASYIFNYLDLKHSIMFKKKKILNIFWYTYQRNHRKATNNKEVNMHLDFLTSQMIITCVKVKKIN